MEMHCMILDWTLGQKKKKKFIKDIIEKFEI